MKKIQILMSSYNGRRFIRQQLDSILAQDCETAGVADFKLLIRDDGSDDGVEDILNEYSLKFPDRVSWYRGGNVGVIASFFDLMRRADEDADYFALADQDDYWLSGKMRAGVARLEEASRGLGAGLPLLYCCRPTLVDENLDEIESNIKDPDIRPGFGNALIENIVTGCTAVFNGELRRLVIKKEPEHAVMHDRWLYLTASCFGSVFYDEKSYMLYRQHGDNAVGRNTDRLEEFKYRIGRFKDACRLSSRQAAEFKKIFGEELELRSAPGSCANAGEVLQRKRLLDAFLDGKKSLRTRIGLARSAALYRQRSADGRIFDVLIRLNIY